MLINPLHYLKQLSAKSDSKQAKINDLNAQLRRYQLGWEPGHFYSPIPSLDEVRSREYEIFGEVPRQLAGIDLNEQEQLDWFKQLVPYYAQQPFQDTKQSNLRYFFDNPNYSYGEAILLYCMIRHLQPRKIIEIGSGYSSCVSLDTNELFFDGAIACTFIEPYPQLLLSLMKESDQAQTKVLSSPLQEIDPAVFTSLEAGDILLIDSTHVSKVGSDVNCIFFQILPQLNSGVYIHLHDIFYPFEYPKEWIYQGRAWNENYLLRAFLQYNERFKIILFNSFLGCFYHDRLRREMPLCAKNPGTSFWMRKR
ncbi:class I SAM-dependent methyltransferase [Leptolyngbya sp. FACHB-17]|uniref:class I SAM-dependent methyltransferase n=1 Tax=unclassified Leptolyngbya TaxID=2650499 RepID=UPI0018F042B5|nr:class I SAM-dependent methyltransferase [Leptolyngbya sp. FACHB-17]